MSSSMAHCFRVAVMYEAGSNVSIELDLVKDRESGTISTVPSQVDHSIPRSLFK